MPARLGTENPGSVGEETPLGVGEVRSGSWGGSSGGNGDAVISTGCGTCTENAAAISTTNTVTTEVTAALDRPSHARRSDWARRRCT